jgi:hypothetical protein
MQAVFYAALEAQQAARSSQHDPAEGRAAWCMVLVASPTQNTGSIVNNIVIVFGPLIADIGFADHA